MGTWDDIFGTRYDQVGGGAADYTTYDPNNFAAMLQQFISGQQGQPGFNPTAWQGDFSSLFGGLQGMINPAIDKYRSDLLQGKGEESRQAGEAVSSMFAGSGVSGARDSAIGTAMAKPFADVASQVSGAGLGMLGSLAGQGMGLSSGNQQFGANYGQQNQANILQALLGGGNLYSTQVAPTYGAQEGYFGQTMGALGDLGGVAQIFKMLFS